MTFSQSVKSEIIRSVRNTRHCCAKSFLTAVLKSAGSLSIGHGGFGYSIESDNTEFLALCQTLSREYFDAYAEIVASNLSAKGTAIYSCEFDGSVGDKLGLTSRDGDGTLIFSDTTSLLPQSDCCKRAFMQGLFTAIGSVVIPQNEGLRSDDTAKYHLELRFADSAFAEAVQRAYPLAEFRSMARKSHTVLYIKESERIADFLVYVNAVNAKLKLENIIITRSVRNAANRQRNCTVANIDKTLDASAKQQKAIALLRRKGLFEGLPDSLKEIAIFREQNPEATLDEVATALGISKSGANHRFAKLIELSETD